jgi:beta-lactamase class A
MIRLRALIFFLSLLIATVRAQEKAPSCALGYATPTDATLQKDLEKIDSDLRTRLGMKSDQAAAGVLDLKTCRLAMVNPDHCEYAASVAKVGILLAYFQTHPEAATNIDPVVKHELGLMAKASSNEMAAKYSRLLGLKNIQAILNSYDLYNTNHGGGIWVGRHYDGGGERYGDPIADNSHAATVRQLLRYFLWLEQGKLVSPAASKTMRDIFASPDIHQ